jgi:hypothetical protein
MIFLPVRADEIKVEKIKARPTFHQRIEGLELTLNMREMEFFLDNLTYAAHIMSEYEIHPLRIKQTDPNTFYAEDDNGLNGTFSLLQREGRFREYGGTGEFQNTTTGVISADVIASVHYEQSEYKTISNDVEFWVDVNNPFLDFLCRLFRPLLTGILKKNLDVFINATQQMALTVRRENLIELI